MAVAAMRPALPHGCGGHHLAEHRLACHATMLLT
jgi:hypothetical protein